jgi:HNH endonuclease
MSNLKAGCTHKTTKRYPRCTAGPLRNQYLHRIVAAAMVGRALTRDEEVNHKDQDRRNFWFTNLFILGNEDHGWVSAKQSYFMRHRDEQLKAEWDAFMAEQEQKQAAEIAWCKSKGEPWPGRPDGSLQEAWENRNDTRRISA